MLAFEFQLSRVMSLYSDLLKKLMRLLNCTLVMKAAKIKKSPENAGTST